MNQVDKTVTLSIQGMHCTNCAQNIERHLKKNGLSDLNVDFASSALNLTLPDGMPLSSVMEEIRKLGFKASLPEENGQHHHAISNVEKLFIICAPLSVLLMLHMILPFHWLHNEWVQLGLCLPVFLIGLFYFGKSALNSLRGGIPNMDVLIVIGIIASFSYSLTGTLLSLGPDYLFYETAATIITIVLFGNILEHRAVKKTTSAIEELGHLQPKLAKRIEEVQGREIVHEVSASEIKVGDLILLNSGDHIPADGKIIWGEASIDESMISGESVPLLKTVGNPVIGGTVVASGNLKILSNAVGEHSVLSNIIKLVRDAQRKKPRIQRLGDTVSAWFVPFVLIISLLTLGVSYGFLGLDFQASLLRAVAVLVIACPCAMGLATPTAVMVGLGRAAKHGILIKGADTAERLAGVKTIIFDKTGTLTTGNFVVSQLKVNTENAEYVKSIILGLERYSSHPIAKSLVSHFKDAKEIQFQEIHETKGVGITGKDSFGDTFEIRGSDGRVSGNDLLGNDLLLLKNGNVIAELSIADEIKKEAASAIEELNALGVRSVLLSGDSREKCEKIAQMLGINEVYAQKKPDEKLSLVQKLSESSTSAFVGDGINDAPSLAGASVGISLSDATETAIQSAQVLLLHGRIDYLVTAIKLSRLTYLTIKQNLFWAFCYNIVAIPMAAAGYLSPMVAALAMALSDVVVIGNSLRLRTARIEPGKTSG